MRPARRAATGLAGAALVAAMSAGVVGGLAGCSSGSGASSSSSSLSRAASGAGGGSAVSGAIAKPAARPQFGAAAQDSAGGSAASSQATPELSSAVLQDRRLILNGSLSLTVGDVFQTAARVRAIAAGAGGYVGDEQTSGSGRTAASTLQLRVPQNQLGPVTDQVGRLGKVTSRSQTSADVTQQSIDITSRLATQKASVARIRALLAHATKISDIVAIEGELSQRESDLESMEAQLKGLNDAVDLSTLTVSLNAQGAPKPKTHDKTGFAAGLSNGWDAFVTSVVAVLTVLGALLPFGVVLAVVGLPLLVLWRRRRTVPPPPVLPASEA